MTATAIEILARVEVQTDAAFCGGECAFAGAGLCLLFQKKRRKEKGFYRFHRLKACKEGELDRQMQAEVKRSMGRKR